MNVTITQNNNLTLSGTGISDDQVRLITRKISDLSKQGRLSKEAV